MTQHRYPDDQGRLLRERLAAHEGVNPDAVSLGTGSAGFLMELVGHECADGGGVVAYERAFVVYRLAASVAGALYVEAPLGNGFQRDPAALLEVVDRTTRVVLIDNPGNPTGRHLTGDGLQAIAAALPANVTLVIDEAYHEFAEGQDGYEPAATLGLEHERVVIVRTFSKAYALAGLRVGYGFGATALIASLDRRRARFHVSDLAQAGAVAALGDQAHLAHTVDATIRNRAVIADALDQMGVAHVTGLGNFVLIATDGPATPVVAEFARRGVGVRELTPYGLDQHFRVTVGTDVEVDAFLEVAADLIASS